MGEEVTGRGMGAGCDRYNDLLGLEARKRLDSSVRMYYGKVWMVLSVGLEARTRMLSAVAILLYCIGLLNGV